MFSKKLTSLILLTALILIGFSILKYVALHTFFTKNEIVESHGSFDERLNILEERIAVLEDSTKSAEIKKNNY